MKSSLFASDPTRTVSNGRLKSTLRKSATASPHLASTTTSMESKSKQKPPLTPNSRKILSWNLDDLISSYQEGHILPPILSPTIPDPNEPDRVKEEKPKEEKPKEQPKTKELDKIKDIKSSAAINLKSPKPKYPKGKLLELGDDEDDERTKLRPSSTVDVENMNLSLLSPTLPPIFNKDKSDKADKIDKISRLDKLDRTDRTERSDKSEKSDKSNPETTAAVSKTSVKWINKLNDTKPKFLIRIKFEDIKKYKLSTKTTKKKISSPIKLAGLGILTNDKHSKEKEHKLLSNGSEEIKKRDNEAKDKLDPEKQKILSRELSEKLTKQAQLKEKQLDDREKRLQERERQLAQQEKTLQERESRLKNPSSDLSLEQQKKIEQIKQLNQDVLMKELRRPIEDRFNSLSKGALPPKLKTLTPLQREEIKNTLSTKRNHWMQLVKAAKLSCDKQTDEFKSIIVQVDILLMCMIAYDFDERSKVVNDVLPSERSWRSLELDIEDLIQRIEKYATTLKEKNLIEFLRILTCILFQTRAIVIKRTDSILTKVIELYSKKMNDSNSGELKTRIIELQQACIKNHSLIVNDFVCSKPSYLNGIIPVKFPKTWFKKSTNNIHSHYLEDYNYNLVPTNKSFYLPLGIYSELSEISGFLFNIMKEFMEIFNKYNPNSKIDYALQCGK